ncbi:C39 family peptidase [Cellulomonas sp. Sa3CUA2]|jgi:Papain-like cysteine protease AvrRpt2|uniref:C39 family peptidase n=1 Tax=Cellulomonas avistercoris TaxID=2762242 RepID=A0ABR8QDX1_9CELL|nr:papain-like cysteine protease family protein [Cellulomonas avistercoris]MBD7918633.1 C39 family peptidase [Cellulomonas avistercoris]
MRQRSPSLRTVLPSLAVAVGLVLVAPGAAQGVEKILSVTPYKQEQSNWCWAAASKTIVKFQTGNVVAQCTLVKNGKGTSSCANVAGSKSDVMNALSRNGVNPGTERKLDWATVVAEMKTSRPVYSSILWKSGGGHAHVIRGYYDTGYSYGVSYVDPASGTTTSREWGSYLTNSSWTTGTGLIYLTKK